MDADGTNVKRLTHNKFRDYVPEVSLELILENKADSILIHFDVDVIDFDDFPAGDLPHYHGLSFDEAISALDVFIASRKFEAFVITEFNADRDADGILARRLVNAVAKVLRMRGGKR